MRSTTVLRSSAGLLSLAVTAALLTGCGHSTTTVGGAGTAAPLATGTTAASEPADSASPAATPSASASARPSASASASRHPAATAPTRAPTHAAPVKRSAPAPTTKPGPVAPKPPAAPAQLPPLQNACKPSYTGANAAKSDVAAALVAAAGQSRTLTLSAGGTDQLPPLPVNLVKAVAYEESGWQSAILACDGGIGTMQIMPATATWMNNKFGTSADAHTLAGNTQLGAELLDELVAYYGDSDFGGDYNLAPDPVTGRNPLLDVVIAAYNAGAGNVHYTSTTDPATKAVTGTEVIPNPGYLASVKALMTNCACLSY